MLYWQICKIVLSKNKSPISRKRVWFARRVFYGYCNKFEDLPEIEDLIEALEDEEISEQIPVRISGKWILQINLGRSWKTLWKVWLSERLEIVHENE